MVCLRSRLAGHVVVVPLTPVFGWPRCRRPTYASVGRLPGCWVFRVAVGRGLGGSEVVDWCGVAEMEGRFAG